MRIDALFLTLDGISRPGRRCLVKGNDRDSVIKDRGSDYWLSGSQSRSLAGNISHSIAVVTPLMDQADSQWKPRQMRLHFAVHFIRASIHTIKLGLIQRAEWKLGRYIKEYRSRTVALFAHWPGVQRARHDPSYIKASWYAGQNR